MIANDLIDIWRICSPDRAIYLVSKKPLIRRRLDCFFSSTEIQDDITITKIIPAVKSHHSATTLTRNGLDKQPFGHSC